MPELRSFIADAIQALRERTVREYIARVVQVLSSSISQGAVKTRCRLRELIVSNWVSFNLSVIVWDSFVVPTTFALERGIIFYATILAQFPLAHLDGLKYVVAEKDPKIFLRGERLKSIVSYAYWLLLLLMFGCIFSIWAVNKLELQQYIPPITTMFTLSILLFTGITLYLTSMTGLGLHKPRILLRTKARAFFRVASESLSAESRKQQVEGLKLFKKGMDNYVLYFAKRFGFAIREPKRYYNFLRLAILSENQKEIERIRKAIDALACQARKDANVLDNLWAIKNVIGETLWDTKDAYFDVEFKVGLWKWYSSHQDSIRLVIMLASLLVAITALLMK